ncbi:DAK2 domain-containing protein [Tepiditoga spiralis]|uniref:DAK2 domain-containing protein n=1 Tax=Tepiditoga spiralis TaxID=2108365 RepID=UPI001E630FD1|nr:DAK2 domain-containing protein [Tepiditoga spiralis]
MLKRILEGKDIYIGVKKAAEELVKNRDEINALNVFPVPDGDTGSNMSAAMLEACDWMDKVKDPNNPKEVLKILRDGLLMGARGNSGVILSQIFRGFTESLETKKRITTKDFIEALKNAKEVAYQAVIKPVEGTMLTLIRKLAERSEKELADEKDFLIFTEKMMKIAYEIVEETPKYLKKLREANVVDAGAKGVYYIFKGITDAIHGDTEVNIEKLEKADSAEISNIAYEELKYQYCTECVLKLKNEEISKKELEELRAFLEEMGDSIVSVHQGEFLKTHIHTNHPGTVFEKFLEYGEFLKVKVDNMKIQHEHVVETKKTKKEESYPERNWGIVAVSPGKGISEIFKSLGVSKVIFGGQTMNPSVKDITDAIEEIPYEKIILLPNNPNIIMTAEKAAEMTEKEIIVLPTKYIQEGVSSLLGFQDDLEKEELKTSMEEYMKSIVPIQVTYAVRDSEINGEPVKKGEYLIFTGKELSAHGKNMYKETQNILLNLIEEGYEIITIFYGDEAKEKDVQKMANKIMEKNHDVEIEIHQGGQQHYPLLISLE